MFLLVSDIVVMAKEWGSYFNYLAVGNVTLKSAMVAKEQ